MDFYTRRSVYKNSLLAFLKTKTLFLLTDMLGNIGDRLIWAATTGLLNSSGIHFNLLSIHEIKDAGQTNAVLLIPGSGAFDQLFHEWLPDLTLKASAFFQEIIILPSSFDINVPIVAECLSRPNIYAYAREQKSFAAIKAFGRAALCFDCAVFLSQFDKQRAIVKASDKTTHPVLLALRTDQGSLLINSGYMPHPSINQDISVTMPSLDEWSFAITQASSVITDRLHVAVMAVLSGKHLIYFETYNHKIATYFNYTFRNDFANQIKECSLEWLKENDFIVPYKEA